MSFYAFPDPRRHWMVIIQKKGRQRGYSEIFLPCQKIQKFLFHIRIQYHEKHEKSEKEKVSPQVHRPSIIDRPTCIFTGNIFILLLNMATTMW